MDRVEIQCHVSAMNLGKYLFGIREEHFRKVDPEERQGQLHAFNLLTSMFLVLIGLTIASGACYGLVIFNNWVLAGAMALLLGGIAFVLLLFVLYLNLNTDHQGLYQTMTNMQPVFDQHLNHDFTSSSDEELLSLVQSNEQLLRQKHLVPEASNFHLSSLPVSLIKLLLILILSCIVANGLEMLMFQEKINTNLEHIHTKLMEQHAQAINPLNKEKNLLAAESDWMIEMLEENDVQPFLLIDCHSIIMTNELMGSALGNRKTLLDLLFYGMFLIPFVLVRKSKQFAGGVFLREIALTDISTSYLAFLLTQRKCQQIQQAIHERWDLDEPLTKRS